MNVTVYLSLLFVATFGLIAPALARRLPPAVGAWLLTGGAVAATAAANAALALLSVPLLGQIPLIARLGGWSRSTLELDDPVHTPIALAACAAVVYALLRAWRAGTRLHAAHRRSRDLGRSLPAGRELVVVDEPAAYAFAVPGRPGHIVASSGLLRALDSSERRALLTHERAHLRHRHELHLALVQICASACPALALLPQAARLACERWADETAAATTDRTAVASALAIAARTSVRLPAHALAIAETAVTYRVEAMRTARPHLRWWLVAIPVGLLASVAACDANALLELHRLFERAHAALTPR